MSVGTCSKCSEPLAQSANFCPRCGTSVVSDDGAEDPYLGVLLKDNYKILEAAGAGSMGMVYLAEQISLNKRLAIKILKGTFIEDEDALARFEQEARAASALEHPNTISVIDFGQCPDGSPFIAMEYIDGMDLAEVVNKEFPLDQMRIVRIMEQVCSALDEAHAAGIIHRDLKLANIMLSQRRTGEEFVKVLDFGIAKINDPTLQSKSHQPATREGLVVGTPAFMSPEQIQGRSLDARSDIYSLGVVLFVLLTGRLPFQARSSALMAAKILKEPAPQPSKVRLDLKVHPIFDRIVGRAMHRDPDQRFASALEMRRALEAAKAQINRPMGAPSGQVPALGRPGAPPPPALGAPPRAIPGPDIARAPAGVMATTIQSGDLILPTSKERGHSVPEVDDLPDAKLKVSRGIGSVLALVFVLAALGVGAFFAYTTFSTGIEEEVASLNPLKLTKVERERLKRVNDAVGKASYHVRSSAVRAESDAGEPDALKKFKAAQAAAAAKAKAKADDAKAKADAKDDSAKTDDAAAAKDDTKDDAKDDAKTDAAAAKDPNDDTQNPDDAKPDPKEAPNATKDVAARKPPPKRSNADLGREAFQNGMKLRSSNPGAALNQFRKAVRYMPGNRAAWIQISQLARRSGNLAEAKKACLSIIRLSGGRKDTHTLICEKLVNKR